MLINIERTAFLEVNSLQKYKKLFFSTFKLSASTFGGGFVIIPLMQKKFVEELGWIEEDEMMDLTAIAQSSPGAIAVNVSILCYRNDPCLYLLSVPWIEYGAGHSCRTSPCGHCNDRISGYLTVDYGTLRTENASE